jgi:hypothetical protein
MRDWANQMTQKSPTTPIGNQAVLKRAEELDALDAILPFDRRDQLAALLTDDDVATLKHLAQQGMGDNTPARSPPTSDISRPCLPPAPLPWPAPEAGHRPNSILHIAPSVAGRTDRNLMLLAP